jgi:hypothetical protein
MYHNEENIPITLFFNCFLSSKAQNLSNTEKKIVAYINEHLPETDLFVKQSTSIIVEILKVLRRLFTVPSLKSWT